MPGPIPEGVWALFENFTTDPTVRASIAVEAFRRTIWVNADGTLKPTGIQHLLNLTDGRFRVGVCLGAADWATS